MINFTYKLKIQPTRRQIQQLSDYFLNICRCLDSFQHRKRVNWLDSRKLLIDKCSLFAAYITPVDATFPEYKKQATSLTKATKLASRIKEVRSQVLQQVLKQNNVK